ncbi:MAG: disulfide bond formation protein B [Nanoarchaeota archaeon]|nr:disulfide bond formation protein B [Nanoarchaeota archaeon]
MADLVTQALSFMTLLSDVLLVLGIILYHQFKNHRYPKLLAKNAPYLIITVALVSMMGSLFFSEIKGFEPCKLCWYQRIFMYPIFFIGVVGLRIKQSTKWQVLTLSVLGGVVAIYHVLSNIFSTVCTDGCAIMFFKELGYVTIPVMSLTAFLVIIFLASISK